MVSKANQRIFLPKVKKNLSLKLGCAVCIRVMNFGPLNEPLKIKNSYFSPKVATLRDLMV